MTGATGLLVLRLLSDGSGSGRVEVGVWVGGNVAIGVGVKVAVAVGVSVGVEVGVGLAVGVEVGVALGSTCNTNPWLFPAAST